MSTGYDLECVDHRSTFDEHDQWTNQKDSLIELWRTRILLPPENPPDSPYEITVEWQGYKTLSRSERDWMREHSGCHVRVVDEYGWRFEFDGTQVPKVHDCPNCRCRP